MDINDEGLLALRGFVRKASEAKCLNIGDGFDMTGM